MLPNIGIPPKVDLSSIKRVNKLLVSFLVFIKS